MNELQIFNFENQQVRTVNQGSEVWFVAKDVCDVLTLTNPTEAIRALDEDEKSTLRISEGGPEVNIINEAGLYSLVIRSNKPEAKAFKRWVTHDVIPSIRKTGTYALKPMTQAELTAAIAQNQVEIERKVNTALEVANKASKQITNALDVFAAPVDKDWRQSMNTKMRGICQEYGLSYLAFYGDLYQELEDLARVDLQACLTRLRARLAANGATKTACKAMTKLEVIERDPKLKPIFEGIVRKYQAKYVSARLPDETNVS